MCPRLAKYYVVCLSPGEPANLLHNVLITSRRNLSLLQATLFLLLVPPSRHSRNEEGIHFIFDAEPSNCPQAYS
jgi:hypothetical protein